MWVRGRSSALAEWCITPKPRILKSRALEIRFPASWAHFLLQFLLQNFEKNAEFSKKDGFEISYLNFGKQYNYAAFNKRGTFHMLITKLNLQLTILLRKNLTLRSRSICAPNALHLRSERVPFWFQTRSGPFAFRTRSFTFLTRSKMRSKAFQCIPANNVSKTYMLHLKERLIWVVLLKIFHNYESITRI